MGDKRSEIHPLAPKVTHRVTSIAKTSDLVTCSAFNQDATLKRGHILGAMRPCWLKTVESEERIKWLMQMIKKGLLVRDIEAFLKSTSDKLRSENSKIKEEERKSEKVCSKRIWQKTVL